MLLAGATSHLQVIHGWRGTFLLMGLVTLLLSWILYMAKMEVASESPDFHGVLLKTNIL